MERHETPSKVYITHLLETGIFGNQVTRRCLHTLETHDLFHETRVLAERSIETAKRHVVSVRIGNATKRLGVHAGRGTPLAGSGELLHSLVRPWSTTVDMVLNPLKQWKNKTVNV